MINPGLQKYEVVLANQYYLRELIESITLEESLSQISYMATIKMVVTSGFPSIGPGMAMRVSGVPFGGTTMAYLLYPGVLWTCDSTARVAKHLTATVYDKTIYLAKSEDEYLFPAGTTASQRLEQYCSDWGIPLAGVADTGTVLPTSVYKPRGKLNTKMSLSKGVHRVQPIWNMILEDLKETVLLGGAMYRPRMTPDGLELFELGTNDIVWVLETDESIEQLQQKRTLEGAVTQVKVLGNAPTNTRSPVMAIEKSGTDQYGTLQRVIQDSRVTTTGDAQAAANEMLSGGPLETITVTGVDINTIRAGDKVQLNGMNLLTASVRHELGSPGRITIQLADEGYIRRKYYARYV